MLDNSNTHSYVNVRCAVYTTHSIHCILCKIACDTFFCSKMTLYSNTAKVLMQLVCIQHNAQLLELVLLYQLPTEIVSGRPALLVVQIMINVH